MAEVEMTEVKVEKKDAAFGGDGGKGYNQVDLPRIIRNQAAKNPVEWFQKYFTKNKPKGQGLDMDDLKKEISIEDHMISTEALFAKYNTTMSAGLSSADVTARTAITGPNLLSPPMIEPEYIKFMKIIFSGFSLLLLGGSIISFIGYGIQIGAAKAGDVTDLDNLYIGSVLFIVVVISAVFTWYQEHQSSNIMESFAKMIPKQTKVLRDGKWTALNVEDLVVGDIVEIEKGDAIPADVRILKCTGLKVDNSSLTGESEPLGRAPECSHENPLETKNMAFYGTNAVEGAAIGCVILTGDYTMIGRIAGLVNNTEDGKTPIAIEIDLFVRNISFIAVFLGVLFLILSIVINGDVISSIVFMIGIIVANVPEGLLATVTVSLTLTAKRMAVKNVLIKNLEAVETLGSTSAICSDKTGTLTQNRMTVAHVWYDGKICGCDTVGGKEGNEFDAQSSSFKNFQNVGVLCNRAVFDGDLSLPVLQRSTLGDASESAIIKFCEALSPIEAHREQYPKLAEIPFNSANKYQVSIHEQPGSSKLLLVMKGAPERILARCSTIMVEGKAVPLDDAWKAKYNEAYEDLGGRGERVLGFCSYELSEKFNPKFEFNTEDPNFPLDNLTFSGLIALIDPPRPGVPEAVAQCQRAGIKVIMVTGDHPITAKAIAQGVNIILGDTVEDIAKKENIPVEEVDPARAEAVVVHGTQVADFTEADWDRVLAYPQIVFARTSPQQKLVIVEHNQNKGYIVAVTGDGVNDSPALKKADIGIAMGIMGSDVSKEAANMILLDDNFASIVKGIEEGRIIFDNLKKSIAYTLSSNIPEIVPFLLFVVISIPLPLTVILILCVDLGTDMFPAISLAHEKAESDIMMRPPRNSKIDRLVNWRLIGFSYLQIGVIQALAGLTTYFYVMNQEGIASSDLVNAEPRWSNRDVDLVAGKTYDERREIQQKAQSAYFVAIVIVQWADLLICKTRKLSLFQQGPFSNRILLYGLLSETILAIMIVYIPGLNSVFGARQLDANYLWPALPFSLFIVMYDETRKFIIRKNPDGIVARFTYY